MRIALRQLAFFGPARKPNQMREASPGHRIFWGLLIG